MSNKRNVRFIGVDDWNRPVFKVMGGTTPYYAGSTSKLFSHDTDKKVIKDYFKDKLNTLLFFGYSFNCEPEGCELDYNLEFTLID